ncbi:uncharacterized protein LOC132758427 [Ruditapes philippinarum]|uniref:uncharacterized protein LOC132758427 n=1 Tax=Ruditapes philippinarum TaxID=129788 RepID=UPI00295B62CD|nr:uncharacterized protein LOC132758427 [Ruditapes philippinarum]
MQFYDYIIVFALFCEFIFCQDNQTLSSATRPVQTTANSTSTETTLVHSPTESVEDNSDSDEVDTNRDERLQRSRAARMYFLRQHVLDSLGWTSPPDIDPETKRRLLLGMQTPVYVTRQKHCYFPACDLPMIDLPDYMNRSIWFDTSSRNIRYFFAIPSNPDPNLDITSAVVRLHLKRREDCPCAYDSDHSTSRLHIKIYQYRKPIRSHARLRHSNMRLIDAKMVTWDSARWVSLHVTEAVKRIVTRGRRNGGFEVHVRDMEENILDAKTVIDPTVCTTVTEYECTQEEAVYNEDNSEPDDPNFSPVLEISSTTTTRLDIS